MVQMTSPGATAEIAPNLSSIQVLLLGISVSLSPLLHSRIYQMPVLLLKMGVMRVPGSLGSSSAQLQSTGYTVTSWVSEGRLGLGGS